MNTTKFSQLIQTYGCNPNKWPTEYKEQMVQYVHANKSCLDNFQAERELDDILNLYAIKPPSQTLFMNILQKTRSSSHLDVKNLFMPFFPKFSALSAALILGLSLGVYQHSGYNENDFIFNTFIDTMTYNATNENEMIL